MELAKIIEVIEDKCVNCHQCISVCPSKFANDGSDNVIHVNHDLCIGCGQCIKACTHDARVPVDDFSTSLAALNRNEKVIAIVAPAVAASFPDTYLNLNGWLKHIGVEAIFDVSFGAELTIKSYLEHIKENPGKTVIAQPCPAIVTYVQIHRPELLEFLAPAHSPMLHTAIMAKVFYPEYKKHKVMVISPCMAKRREFDETGEAHYNVTFSSILNFFKERKINITEYEKVEFTNAPAERATLFSTPGGLMETAEREVPGIRKKIRKIEGPTLIYNYLDHLHSSILKGIAPVVVDCLNCDAGCNGGSGTKLTKASHDEIEHHINQRAQEYINAYNAAKSNDISQNIDKYWKPIIYNRSYLNLSENLKNNVKIPDNSTLDSILKSMHKLSKKDIYNCSSCGYNTCEGMAIAIYNNLNKRENCFHYKQKVVEAENQKLDIKIIESEEKLTNTKSELITQSEQLLNFLSDIKTLIN